MNSCLWKTCGYVCVKALDNLWVNSYLPKGTLDYTQVILELSTAYPQVLIRLDSLQRKHLRGLFCFSTANTSTTLYISKLIYREEEMR